MIGHIPIETVIAREYKLFEYGDMTAGEALYVYLREDTPARDVVSLRDLLVNWYTDHQPLAKK